MTLLGSPVQARKAISGHTAPPSIEQNSTCAHVHFSMLLIVQLSMILQHPLQQFSQACQDVIGGTFSWSWHVRITPKYRTHQGERAWRRALRSERCHWQGVAALGSPSLARASASFLLRSAASMSRALRSSSSCVSSSRMLSSCCCRSACHTSALPYQERFLFTDIIHRIDCQAHSAIRRLWCLSFVFPVQIRVITRTHGVAKNGKCDAGVAAWCPMGQVQSARHWT